MATTKKAAVTAVVDENDEPEVEPIPVFDDVPKDSRPKFMVVGSTFYAQTTEGELRIPLSFKTKLFRSISGLADETDQVFALLDGIGDKQTAATLDELDIFDTMELVESFFQAFTEKNRARLGESSRSSH